VVIVSSDVFGDSWCVKIAECASLTALWVWSEIVGGGEEGCWKGCNSKSHSNQTLRRLRCMAPHRTACTASSPCACLLGLELKAT